jgi:hypothetical protein
MTISAWEVHRNVFIDVVLVESNRAPLTLAKRRILSIPRLNRSAVIMDFILTYLLMLFQQIMLYSTGSSRGLR